VAGLAGHPPREHEPVLPELLTAFYVDNGPHLLLYNRLPTIVLWIGPSLVGLPLILRALIRRSVLQLSVLARLPSVRFDPRSRSR
jgi:hypothetical protein